MFECFKVMTYMGQKVGVTKDGEKYVALELRDTEENRNYSFVTRDFELVEKIVNAKFINFQELKLKLCFKRVFNPNTRFSNWQVEVIDVLNLGVNNAK